MRGYEYAELAAFAAIVDRGSFAAAARHLRIAPSSLSQTIKKLEARLDVQLLHRTTRSVSMTGAGLRLYKRFRPAMQEMEAAVIDLREVAGAPSGLVRLHMPRAAYSCLFEQRLGEFYRAYPDVHVEIEVDDALINIVASGIDLDVRLAGAADPATHTVLVGSTVRHVAVASAQYLRENGRPLTPSDLHRHHCILWRRPGTEHPYLWSFLIDGSTVLIDVAGPLTVSHCDLAVTAAADSVGIAFVLEQHAREAIDAGHLEELLTPFLPAMPGWTVCHPRGSRPSAAAQAVLDFLDDQAPLTGVVAAHSDVKSVPLMQNISC